jgi:LmbE family N-acetylglucosaminyl deacetylase
MKIRVGNLLRESRGSGVSPAVAAGTAALLFSCFIATSGSLAQLKRAPAAPPPDARYKADILVIVAHPDDETEVTAYLARATFDEHKRVAAVYCTCGGAGGDTVSQAQGRALCDEREIEARRADAVLGITDVWFLGGLDTPTQNVLDSLGHWNHGAVLERAVRLVRLTRPEVIMTWIPDYVDGENHGDHQASSVIASEAFDLAGNPTAFPEQVAAPRDYEHYGNFTEGLYPWQAEKLYFFSNAAHPEFEKGQGPAYSSTDVSPSRHVPYYEIAARSVSYHLTQLPTGPEGSEATYKAALDYFKQPVQLILGKSSVGGSRTGDVFQGVVPGPIAFHPVAGYHPQVHTGLSIELGGPWQFYRRFWRAHDLEHTATLVSPEAGVGSGGTLELPVIIRNDSSSSAEVELTAQVPVGWKLTSGEGIYPVNAQGTYPARLSFTAPTGSRPDWQTLTISAELNGKPIGDIPFRVSYGKSGP